MSKRIRKLTTTTTLQNRQRNNKKKKERIKTINRYETLSPIKQRTKRIKNTKQEGNTVVPITKQSTRPTTTVQPPRVVANTK
jgi:hypothetical protein